MEPGTDGAVASTTTVREPEETETFPATSVATAVTTRDPSPSTAVVQEKAPDPLAVHAVPLETPSTESWIDAPTSAVPVIVGVVSFVTPSLFDEPESEAASTTKPVGAATELSTVTLMAVEAAETFECWSVAVAVIEATPADKVPVVHEKAPVET